MRDDLCVPNAPRRPARAFRLDDELWRRLQERAEQEGRTASDVVRDALAAYLRRPAHKHKG